MASTVIITGASQGIGKATALRFAQGGYNLVLASRNADRLNAAAQELKLIAPRVTAIPTDTRDADQVKTLIDRAISEYGSIDVLVNNAGVYISGPADSFTLEDWHTAIDINLWGYIHTIHALLPHFLSKGSGTIVNVSSSGGKVPIPYLVPYSASKFAVTGLTQSLQSELSPKGITVCGIYPNLIKSDFMERAIFRGKDEEDAIARRKQLEQVLSVPVVEKPDDVAKAILDAVKHKKTEVIVGSAGASVFSNRLFPDLLQWVMRRTFKNSDKDY
ncbi:SDR family oxidoreductase [Leptolyngbya sp. FACHB-17]|uniref:SDR family NAD(P)-dependent oxidoreductase n=1 Tax=unclassified Leptolyngbya TaxID=2650499 RepID=UPI00167FE5D3|nr:SDR family oxidoreductase [Leptolyngbya sp. FACHB-17]MBD2079076.1 SDR family oxidoreductase [Leptolyngbya sp. FACHB-17]